MVTVIILFAENFTDKNKENIDLYKESEMFRTIRHITLGILISSVALFALVGILAIWDILGDINYAKSFASIAVVAFGSLVIVITCLNRERSPLLKQKLFGKNDQEVVTPKEQESNQLN